MVLSSAELQEMIKKAHAAEGQTVNGPWPDANGQDGGALSKAALRKSRIQMATTFVLGIIVGAGGLFAIQYFLMH